MSKKKRRGGKTSPANAGKNKTSAGQHSASHRSSARRRAGHPGAARASSDQARGADDYPSAGRPSGDQPAAIQPGIHQPSAGGRSGEQPGFRSGYVSILGRPNAGKSTLLNALIGAKVAIVSEKPQTTRASIQGVVNAPNAQIIFLDTPGIHESDTLINRRMMETVRDALTDRDVLLYLADSTTGFNEKDAQALDVLKRVTSPVLLLLTKIDRVQDKRRLLPLIEQYKAAREFDSYIPVSSTKREGLERVVEEIIRQLPEGPAYFPPDYLTDQPERYLAAELIREQALRETRQEVPHAIAVLVDQWTDTPKLTRIAATIYVERPGQKAIVIGAQGATLKKIGTLARLEMERIFARKIFLELFVKVLKDWRENPGFLTAIDWRSMTGAELDSEPHPDK
jgi:GTP-binding protein Era